MSSVRIKRYNSSNKAQFKTQVIPNVEYSLDINRKTREESFIKDIKQQISKCKSVAHVLKDDTKIYGLIVFSIGDFNKKPSLQIDYLFVNRLFRGQILENLDETKTSHYLVEYAISVAKKIYDDTGLRYITLLPDDAKLQKIYEELEFKKLGGDEWMYMKL